MDMTEKTIGAMDRRTFLNNSVKVIGGSAALGSTALSYSWIAGANDRISIGHSRIGNRGPVLAPAAPGPSSRSSGPPAAPRPRSPPPP